MSTKQLLIGAALAFAFLIGVYFMLIGFALYMKSRTIILTEQTMQRVVDADRTQNYLKDHCEKYPDHLRCALIK